MNSTDISLNLVDSYFGLMKNLSDDNKLEIISKLSNSMKSSKRNKSVSLESLYGGFASEKTADEIINEIRTSRNFRNNREEL